MGKGGRQLVGQLAFALTMFATACTVSLFTTGAMALPAPAIKDLAFGESDEKIQAIGTLVNSGDSAALSFLQSLLDGEVQTSGEEIVLVVKGGTAVDAYTGKVVTPLPETLDDVIVNNRMRQELTTAIAAWTLASPDRPVRLAAAKVLQARVEGTPLEALCGHVWVPSRDPKQLPVCQKCKDVYGMYQGFNDGLDDTPRM